MSRGIIYLITNKENGHKYVGQSNQAMNKQWQQHIIDSRQMSQKPLHKAFRKYGVHRFNIQEIDECDESLLDEREQYWIEYYNTYESQGGYNEFKKEEKIIPTIKDEPKQPKKVLENKSKCDPWGSLTIENRGNGKHSGLKIRSKNLQTGICTDYENARMASLELTGNPNRNANILLAARKNGTAYGHKWQLLEEKSKKKAVFSVSKKTGEIENRYESIAAAVRSICPDTNYTGITKSLRNPGRYSWKGYYWYYN